MKLQRRRSKLYNLLNKSINNIKNKDYKTIEISSQYDIVNDEYTIMIVGLLPDNKLEPIKIFKVSKYIYENSVSKKKKDQQNK